MIKNILYWLTLIICAVGLMIIGFICGVKQSKKNTKQTSKTDKSCYVKCENMTDNTNPGCVPIFDFTDMLHFDMTGVDALTSKSSTPTSVRFVCDGGTFIKYKPFCVVDADGYITMNFNEVAQFIDVAGNETTIYKDEFESVKVIPRNEVYDVGGKQFVARDGWYIYYNGIAYKIYEIKEVDHRYWED